ERIRREEANGERDEHQNDNARRTLFSSAFLPSSDLLCSQQIHPSEHFAAKTRTREQIKQARKLAPHVHVSVEPEARDSFAREDVVSRPHAAARLQRETAVNVQRRTCKQLKENRQHQR